MLHCHVRHAGGAFSLSRACRSETAPAQEVVLPGNIQPYISSPIYARTDGYLKKWYFDIGAHVKARSDLLGRSFKRRKSTSSWHRREARWPPRRPIWNWPR